MLTIRLDSTRIVTDLLPFSRSVYGSSGSVRHLEIFYSEFQSNLVPRVLSREEPGNEVEFQRRPGVEMLTIRLDSTRIVTDLLPFSRSVYCSSRSVRHLEIFQSEFQRNSNEIRDVGILQL